MPVRYLLPRRARVWYEGHRSAIGFLFLFACFVASLAITKADSDAQDRAIQSSRVEVALDNCRAQNDRHDDTIARLDSIIAALPPGRRRRRAETNRAGTVLLINALAPKRDCMALARQIRSVDD